MVFDRVVIDEVNRAVDVHESATGKSVNAARVLKMLGQEPIALGFLGGDTGQALRRDCDARGIRHSFVDVASPTRLCVTVIDRSTRHATELVQESNPVTPAEVEKLIRKLAEQLAKEAGGLAAPSMLLLSGSLAPGVPAEFYRQCIELANAAGWRTVIDAAGEPLALALAARPFLVKPNRAELSRTVNLPIENDGQLRDAIRQLTSAGIAWVVVTLGKDGAVVSDGQQFWRLSSPRVETFSAIGSGDSFAAGLVAGIMRGLTVPEATKLAIACGAANALTPMPAIFDIADVERLIADVTVSEMEAG
jgi:tagatose 6-phosphate kinase